MINNRLYCSIDHATEYAKANRLKGKAKREKAAKADIRERKEKIKKRSDYAKEAQTAVNRYIRARDKGKPCISCGKPDNGKHQRHAGHYQSRGAHPELAYNVLNNHGQCATCNTYLSGNLIDYRKGLIVRYGQWIVDYLDSHHDLKKYSIDDLKRIKRIFNKRARFYEKRKL